MSLAASLTRAEDRWCSFKKFYDYDMVSSNIKRIEKSESLSSEQRFKLHRELDGRYHACVKDWRVGFGGADKAATVNNTVNVSLSFDKANRKLRI